MAKPAPPKDDFEAQIRDGLDQIMKRDPLAERIAGVPAGGRADLNRFPFLFLVDASQSTAYPFKGQPTDNAAIVDALTKIFKILREPPRGSDLALHHKEIDVAVVSYNTGAQTLLNWTPAPELPDPMFPIATSPGTKTANGFKEAFRIIHDRQTALFNQRTPTGIAHIFHLTDGAPTDMAPGDSRWQELKTKLARITATAEIETRKLAVAIHFITPNGCDPDFPGNKNHPSGQNITGFDAIKQLAHPSLVVPCKDAAAFVPNLVDLVTGTIIKISSNATEAGQAVNEVKIEQQFDDRTLDDH